MSWTYNGQTVEPQEVLKLEFILAVSPQIGGITYFNFDIMVQATVIHAQITLTDLHTIHLYVDGEFPQGENLKVKLYSYSGTYQEETTVWNGTTPTQIILTTDLTLDSPIENATLVLTDSDGNVILNLATFLVRRSDLIKRLAELDAAWTYASPSERPAIMMEIIAIDAQWPFAPP